jgi:hypothetical protein
VPAGGRGGPREDEGRRPPGWVARLLYGFYTLPLGGDLGAGCFQGRSQEELSDKYYERSDREDRLYNLIRLYLDADDPEHNRLLEALEYANMRS